MAKTGTTMLPEKPAVKTSKESGASGKPGEATERTQPLDAAAVARMLSSEFAADEETTAEPVAPKPGEEATPAEETPAVTETPEKTGTEGEPEPETPEQETTEGTEPAEQEEQPEQPGSVPEALQQAIAQWEENGGGELPPALQGLVEKRIGKLTAQREEAMARAERLEQQLQRMEQAVPGPTGGATDEKQLNQLETAAQLLVDDAQNYLDDTATEEERTRVERYLASERLDAKGLKRRVRELSGWLASVPAERERARQFRAAEAALEPKARQWFPGLYDKSSAEYAEAQEILRLVPELRSRTPGHQVALGVYLLGLKEFRKLHPEADGKPEIRNPKSEVKRTVVKAPVKTPMAGGGAAAPNGARQRGAEVAERAARERFEKAPTRANVTELLKRELRS